MNDIEKRGNATGAMDNKAKVISLDEVRRRRTQANPVVEQSTQPSKVRASAMPDFAAIAREPDYATRRRLFGEALTAVSGMTFSKRSLDFQMITNGFAAGHGCDDSPYPLGSSTDDPAVVVGLVLHFSRGNRIVPIPPPLMRQLDYHAAAGSTAARLVRDWLRSRTAYFGNRQFWIHEGGRT